MAAVVAAAVVGPGIESVHDGDEAELLAKLDLVLSRLSPGVMITWNGAGFDLPFLHDRARLLDVPIGLRIALDLSIPGRREPLPGHAGAYQATWHQHRHVDGYQLFRADVGATLGLPCGLKPLSRFVGLEPIEVDRERIHELTDSERRAYVASDAHLARLLVLRRADGERAMNQAPSSIGS